MKTIIDHSVVHVGLMTDSNMSSYIPECYI